MSLSLYDETTSLQLDALTDYMVMRYAKQSPAPASVRSGADNSDFALTSFEWSNVTESLELLIRGATATEVRTRTRAIQGYLDKAQRRQKTGMGPRVTLSDSNVGESEILAGRLLLTNAHDQVDRLNAEAVLSITRRYFWESPRTTILTLTSSEDSTPAAVVDVYGNDDAVAAATNWVNIPAAAVTGVLPTPAEIKITNMVGAPAPDWREIFVTNTVFSDPANFDPFLLGSEATPAAAYTLTTSEAVGWTWTPTILTNARLADLAGRYYRVLVAFSTGAATTGVYLRAVVRSYATGGAETDLFLGALVPYSGEGLIDLGPVPIPPGGYDTLGTDISLTIRAFRPAGGASMTIDFVQLTPAGDGLFQRVVLPNFAGSAGNHVILDGPKGRVYFDPNTGLHRHIVRARGLPILLFPGVVNRLRFLYREQTGFVAGRRMEIRIWYQPRYIDV